MKPVSDCLCDRAGSLASGEGVRMEPSSVDEPSMVNAKGEAAEHTMDGHDTAKQETKRKGLEESPGGDEQQAKRLCRGGPPCESGSRAVELASEEGMGLRDAGGGRRSVSPVRSRYRLCACWQASELGHRALAFRGSRLQRARLPTARRLRPR